MARIEALLFDVDGVLVTGRPVSEHLVRDHGLTPATMASFFRGPFVECLVGRADLKHTLATHLPRWGWPGSVDAFLAYWFQSEHVLNEPLLLAMQQYRQQGVRCYLATNQEHYRTHYILQDMGFASRVDGMFSSARIGHLKDDPAFFAHVVRTLAGVPAEHILFWDDSATNVTVARMVGLRAEVYRGIEAFQSTMSTYLPHL